MDYLLFWAESQWLNCKTMVRTKASFRPCLQLLETSCQRISLQTGASWYRSFSFSKLWTHFGSNRIKHSSLHDSHNSYNSYHHNKWHYHYSWLRHLRRFPAYTDQGGTPCLIYNDICSVLFIGNFTVLFPILIRHTTFFCYNNDM